MSARLKVLFASLGVRLLIPLLAIVAIVLSVHAVNSFRAMQGQFLRFAELQADQMSAFIRRATHDGMLLNHLADVQSTIENIAEEPEIDAIRIYDKQGVIALSSRREELGRSAALEDTPCATCHAGAAAGSQLPAGRVARIVSEQSVRQISVIVKEPACGMSGCHDQSETETVLGVLDVERSMSPFGPALNRARNRIIFTTLQLMLVIGIIATVFVERVISRPIRSLKEGALRIAGGDLSVRIPARGKHELASLARAFNRMAEDLSHNQRELRGWSQTLEQRVVGKTAELQAAQKQVLHMEKMASLGKLSATVAHELNNPISGMLTYARLIERELQDQPLGDEVRHEIERCLHLVQSECIRCGGIVRNLLVFARSNATDLMTIDLNEVVERSLMLIRHQLEMSRIKLDVAYLAGDGEIVSDPGQLEQALVALFINAAEAMSAGGRLTVRLHGTPDDVAIEVSDTGVGIEADILPQIYEPFFSTKPESGSGLGLAVVYGIVHRHGGTIEVASQPGEGTTFRLQFPRNPPTQESTAESRAEFAGVMS